MRCHRREDAAKEIEVLVSLKIPNRSTLATVNRDWLVVIEREPRRHHCPRPSRQFAVDSHVLPLGKRSVRFGSAVTVERPLVANLFDSVEVQISHHKFCFRI